MAFDDVVFGEGLAYGSQQGGFTFLDQFEADSGDISVRSDSPTLGKYTIKFGNRTSLQATQLRRFFWARRGGLNSFRLRYPMDSSTASDGRSDPTGLDQPVVIMDGYIQLVKAIGPGPNYRRIFLPIDPIIITDNGVVTGRSVDYASGRVGGSYSPNLRAGFRFDVPVRFDGKFNQTYNLVDAIDIEVGVTEVFDLLLPPYSP